MEYQKNMHLWMYKMKNKNKQNPYTNLYDNKEC